MAGLFDFDMSLEDDGVGEFFGGLSASEAKSEYWVGTIVEYAAAVELGGPTNRPQPYLRPATNEVQAKVQAKGLIDIAVNAVFSGNDDLIGKGLEEIAFEVERRAKNKAPVDTGNLRASISTGSTVSSMRGKSSANASFVGRFGQSLSGGGLGSADFSGASVVQGSFF